jgi:hypothetical protein
MTAVDDAENTGASMTELVTIRSLRWVFTRAGRTLRCELSLDPNAFAYELRVAHDDNATAFSEQFGDVARAFDRQCRLEATLLRDGWTLDSYRSSSRVAV